MFGYYEETFSLIFVFHAVKKIICLVQPTLIFYYSTSFCLYHDEALSLMLYYILVVNGFALNYYVVRR